MDKSEQEILIYISNDINLKVWTSSSRSEIFELSVRSVDRNANEEISRVMDYGSALFKTTSGLTEDHLKPLQPDSSSDLNLGPYLGLGPCYFSHNQARVLANIDYATSLLNTNTNVVLPTNDSKSLNFVDLTGSPSTMVEYLQWRVTKSSGFGLVDESVDNNHNPNVNYDTYTNMKQKLDDLPQALVIKDIALGYFETECDLVISDRIKNHSSIADLGQFLLEVYTAWLITRDGGSCVIRLPNDTSHRLMYDIYYLLTSYWDTISIITPIAGYIYKHQRYFVGTGRRATKLQSSSVTNQVSCSNATTCVGIRDLITRLLSGSDIQLSDVVLSTTIHSSDDYLNWIQWIIRVDLEYLQRLKVSYETLVGLLNHQPVQIQLYNINHLYTVWSCPEHELGWSLYNQQPYAQLITWINGRIQ